MPRGPIRVGIVGAGMVAPCHAAGFLEAPLRCRVVAVCDVDEARARDLAAVCDARVCTDHRELLADPGVDLVDVLLPHHLHHPVALAVLDAGKHLLLEKPVALTYGQSLEVCRRARQAGVFFAVAENTRFVHAYVAAERAVRSGALGEIELVRTFLPANERARLCDESFWGRQPALGGGCLLDSGPHTFYLLQWLFGGVTELEAFAWRQCPAGGRGESGEAGHDGVEDNAEVRGRLACGARFQSGFSFTAELPHSERLEVYGTRGALVVDQLADPPARIYAGPTDSDGTALDDVQYDPVGWHFSSILREVEDVVDALWEGRTPAVDPLDCCEAVRLVEAARESARGDGRRIALR